MSHHRITNLVRRRRRRNPWWSRWIRDWRLQTAAAAGLVTGAALEFTFDPRLGRTRRAHARDRIGGMLRRLVRRTRRSGRRTASYMGGQAEHVVRGGRTHYEHPDDVTLAQRVKTELFRPEDAPKGQVLVNVQDGIVQLRGEVPHAELIRELVERARGVTGVRSVESLLHVPGASAPMHQ